VIVSPTLATCCAVALDEEVFDEDDEIVVATEEIVVATDVGLLLNDDELLAVLVFVFPA
jgi:hypothetical protein